MDEAVGTVSEASNTPKRFRTIVADPPWDHEGFVQGPGNPKRGRDRDLVVEPLPYRPMLLEDICSMPVESLAAKDCRLFLWATNKFLPASFEVAGRWGFAFKQMLVWYKQAFSPFGGSVTPNAAEFLLVAVRGAPPVVTRWPSGSVIHAPGNIGGAVNGNRPVKHSQKPEVFLDLVEQVSPGPYLELFARRQRFGWSTWGDQALEHVSFDSLIRSGT